MDIILPIITQLALSVLTDVPLARAANIAHHASTNITCSLGQDLRLA